MTTDNSWANGCSKCAYGIVEAPELTGACELYLERLAQAINGDIIFCECVAGKNYRAFLLNRHKFLLSEARSKPNLAWFAERKTHPDIESALRVMSESYVKAPPIRWDGAESIAPPEAVPTPIGA